MGNEGKKDQSSVKVRAGDVVAFRVPQYQAPPLERAAIVSHVYQSTDPYPVLDLLVVWRPGDSYPAARQAVACDPAGEMPDTWSPR